MTSLSILSASVEFTIAEMERAVQSDPGKRGINAFMLPSGELLAGARSLFRHKGTTEQACLLTGFPCLLDFDPPTETDGPLGAVSIARAYLAVTGPAAPLVLATDACNEAVLLAAVQAAGLEQTYGAGRVRVEAFPPAGEWTQADEARLEKIQAESATVVAIERAGPGADGGYYTMGGYDMSPLIAPLERLMGQRPQRTEGTAGGNLLSRETVGVGDGGNEVGMGKVRPAILESAVPHAAKISCVTSADSLLVCGVSNWGGTALAAALAALARADEASSAPAGAPAPSAEAPSAEAGEAEGAVDWWAKCMPTDADDIRVLQAMVTGSTSK